MDEIRPFKYNLGDTVYTVDSLDEATSSLIIRRFRTTKGNVYTTEKDSNIREEFIIGRTELILFRLSGKLLET